MSHYKLALSELGPVRVEASVHVCDSVPRNKLSMEAVLSDLRQHLARAVLKGGTTVENHKHGRTYRLERYVLTRDQLDELVFAKLKDLIESDPYLRGHLYL